MILRRRTATLALAAGAVLASFLPAGPAAAQGDLPPVEAMLADRAIGPEDAPVTVIEYASLTCPHCGTFHTETLPHIKQEYVDTGKVRFVFRDFPIGALAMGASMIARCAPEQQYFGLLEIFFSTMDDWARADRPLNILAGHAKLAGMTDAQIQACITNQDLLRGLEDMRANAMNEFGVTSTPSFIINGQRVSGAHGPESFSEILDGALADAE